VRDYQPTTPPPVTDWKSEVWQKVSNGKPLALNPNAALQMKIFADNFVPVQSEFYYTAQDGINRACMGTSLNHLAKLVNGAFIMRLCLIGLMFNGSKCRLSIFNFEEINA
jgi:hypothetical protein